MYEGIFVATYHSGRLILTEKIAVASHYFSIKLIKFTPETVTTAILCRETVGLNQIQADPKIEPPKSNCETKSAWRRSRLGLYFHFYSLIYSKPVKTPDRTRKPLSYNLYPKRIRGKFEFRKSCGALRTHKRGTTSDSLI